MAQDPLVRRESVSASCNRLPDEGLETQKYSQYPKEHPANCPLWWRLSNGLGVYLSWLEAGFSHHTRQPNWWSVHQRCLATSCCPPFRQPPTSYKACVYGWQRQASSFKSSNRLPSKWSHDFCSLASHEPGFESHRAYLGHGRPSYTGSGTSCAKHSSVGSSSYHNRTSVMMGVIQALGGYTRNWTLNNRCRQVIHKWRFESEMTILSCFLNCEGQYLKWTCFTAKTGHHCILEIIWSVISWYLSYHSSFQKNMGVLNFFLCVYYYEITRDNELRPAAFLITLILLGPCSNSAPLSSLDVCIHPPTRSLASSKIIWNIHYMYMFCNVTCVSNLLHHYQSLEKLSEIEVYVL